MIKRDLEPAPLTPLRQFPVVALVGLRQVGKTTLARPIARKLGRAVYLDMERPSDVAKLFDAELYLEPLTDRLVILDEIQRRPRAVSSTAQPGGREAPKRPLHQT